jgi:DNA-binding transcriptional ArsR family regulator
MSQQSVGQAVRRSALDAQAVRRKERAQRERRLEGLAVEVMTALGERDAAVRDAERRACAALQTMTDEEGLCVREITRQLPRSTASRWIAAAREAGYLAPSEGIGKAGGWWPA